MGISLGQAEAIGFALDLARLRSSLPAASRLYLLAGLDLLGSLPINK